MLISDPADPARIRERVPSLVSRTWDSEELRRGAERFSEPCFRTRLAKVLSEHGAR